MTDKLEKDLKQLPNIGILDFFRIVDYSGESCNAQIGSALNKLGILYHRGTVDKSFNTLENGIWEIYNANTFEGNPGFYYGTIISFIGNRLFGFQLAFNQLENDPIIKFRIKDNTGNFGNWKSISFT